jgi:preprotein translocase subunit YajC
MDPLLIFMVLAVGAMFLLTSRTRKQQRQAGEFRQKLEIGDEVMTGSGLFGTIVDIDGDVVSLESPSGGRTDWLRAAISKQATPPWADEDDEPAEDDEELADDESDDDETFLEADDEDELDATPDTWDEDEPDRDRRRSGADGSPAVPLAKGTPPDADPDVRPQEPPTRP